MIKRNTYRILVFSAIVLSVVGVTIVLTSANDKSSPGICSGVKVQILGDKEFHCVEEDDVRLTVEKVSKSTLVNQAIEKIDLPRLEKSLEDNVWIEDAQLYFDSRNKLNIAITERTPLVRVFTTSGSSFYLDQYGFQLPVLEQRPIKVHVVTGFTAARKWNPRDSAEFRDVKKAVQYISSSSFWNAQVGQIDITAKGLELVPVIGDHVVRIGNAEDIENKLHRAFVFYRQVMSKTGFNKYAAIDVQYDGQVVAVKKDPALNTDDPQIGKNIQGDDKPNKGAVIKSEEKKEETKPLKKNSVPVKTHPNPTRKPKAVMQVRRQ